MMTQDEIIRMARECGDELFGRNQRVDYEFDIHGLERFAALVAAHEREKQAEQEPVGNRIVGNDADGYTVENLYASPQSVNWSDRAVQIRALQAIGAEWYDGKIRNQWIADTCHELTKVIGGAAPVSIEAAVLAEREACANVCDEQFKKYGCVADKCAAAIRARS